MGVILYQTLTTLLKTEILFAFVIQERDKSRAQIDFVDAHKKFSILAEKRVNQLEYALYQLKNY